MQRPPLCKNNPSSLVHDNKTLFATLDSSLGTFLTWPNLPDPMSELKNFTLEGMLFCVLIEKRRERNDAVRHAVAGCSSLFNLHLIKTYFFLSCYPRGFVNCILINLNGKRNKASGKRGKVWVFYEFMSDCEDGAIKRPITHSLLCSAARSRCRRFLNQFETLIETKMLN